MPAPGKISQAEPKSKMTTLVVILHVFVCIVLIAVILLQAGRGQGLSWGSFGGSPQSIFGTKTASFFTRLTTICAILFLVTVIALNIIEIRRSRSLVMPHKPITKVDMAKLKQALEEAQKKAGAKDAPAAQEPARAAPAVPAPTDAVPEAPTAPA